MKIQLSQFPPIRGGYSEDLNQWKFSFRNSHQSGEGNLKTWTNENLAFAIPTNQGRVIWRLEPMKIQLSQFPPIRGGYSEDLNQWKFSLRNSHQSGERNLKTWTNENSAFAIPTNQGMGFTRRFASRADSDNCLACPEVRVLVKQIKYEDSIVTHEVISLWEYKC